MKPYKDTETGRFLVRWRERRGEKVVRRKRTFQRRGDAVTFIENLAAERRKDADAAKRTFNDYADRFLTSAASRCKARTVDSYACGLIHARAFLGNRAVGTLRAIDARDYLTYLTGQHVGNKARSIRSSWRTFAAVLDDAVFDEALPSNPAHKVTLPTANARGERKFRPAFLTAAEVEALASRLGAPYDLLLVFTAYTGLRRGEVAGLNLGHVRLMRTGQGWRGTVRVEQTARKAHGDWIFDTPKSERSTRDVPMPPWLAERMHHYISAHPFGTNPEHPLWPGRILGGAHHGDVSYERRWEPESFCRNLFAPAVRASGLGHVRFHDLRHTFASLCADNGIKVERVSAWMGHSSIVITWTTYTHLFRGDSDHQAVEALGDPSKAVAADNVLPFKQDA